MIKLKEPALIRILIVDDHEAVRKGVRSILSSRQDIEVCGEASDGRDAINTETLLDAVDALAIQKDTFFPNST